jgi:hypothetical protein
MRFGDFPKAMGTGDGVWTSRSKVVKTMVTEQRRTRLLCDCVLWLYGKNATGVVLFPANTVLVADEKEFPETRFKNPSERV